MYKIKEHNVPIDITFREALTVLPKRGINILNLLDQDNAASTLQVLLMNDEKMLDLWQYYVNNAGHDAEKLLDDLTPENFRSFKKELWEAVVNFSDPQVQGGLRQMKKMLEEEIAKAFQPQNLKKQFLATAENAESSPGN
jgi:hypothetical protein